MELVVRDVKLDLVIGIDEANTDVSSVTRRR